MSPARTPSRSLSIATLIAVLGLLLTACGSSDSSAATDPQATTASAASGGAGPGGPGGFDQEQLDAIQQCLEAAGLGDAFPTDLPTERPGDFPTDGASREPPSGFATDLRSGDLPSDLPSGGPSGGPRGGLGAFNDPDVQAALQACGIELPSGPPSSRASS
jgi:hypothetical protein